MSNAQHKDDLQSLWQSMPTPEVTISADEMRTRASAFQRKIQRRNLVEYIAGAIVIAAFAWYATWPEPATPLWPIANLMIIAGALLVMWNLHRLARVAATPATTSVSSLIDHHRGELVRQRDALKSVWLWYIAPVVPGVILWFAAMAIGAGDQMPLRVAIGLGSAALAVAVVFVVVILLNRHGAARLQRMIDELDSYKE